MRIPLLLLVFIVTPLAALTQPCDNLDSLAWMEGEWVAQGETYVTQESWVRVSAQTYEGAGRVTVAATGEERSTESMRLVVMSGEVFMLPKAAHNPFPTPFKLVECSGDAHVFENKEHDFPKQLTYTRVGSDSLHVIVSDGGTRGFKLRFGRKD